MSGTLSRTNLSDEQQQAIVGYANSAQLNVFMNFPIRDAFEEVDRLYMREKDYTQDEWQARTQVRKGNANAFENVTVPIVMPQVEAAMGYYTNVFLTGYPIFGVAADPTNMDAATMMEAVIAENSVAYSWARELSLFFRDGLKYNFHGIECCWDTSTTFDIVNDTGSTGGMKAKPVLRHGNKLRRMDPYNTFFDVRVAPSRIHIEGEYAGYNRVISRVQFKQFMNDLGTSVPPSLIERALASSWGGGTSLVTTNAPFGYYIPSINPFPTLNKNSGSINWMQWANGLEYRKTVNINYQNTYILTTLYARILPSDFSLDTPGKNTPQVWKFVIVNGQVVVVAERQTNVHSYLPILFGQPLEDGLELQTKSFASNVEAYQSVASALWNGFMASKRRLVGDRVLYDPSRVREADINSKNPAAKIPVRNSAYGKPLDQAVFPFPYRDEATSSFLQAASLIQNMANMTNGQNPAQQGQFVKGNKTRREYEDTMGHGNTRNQQMALATEQQVFIPLKEIIKLNILQYQTDAQITLPGSGVAVPVQMQTLRQKAVQFKVSDGMLPEDKLLSTDEWGMSLQVIGSSPQIATGYNMSPLFSYIMKQRGVDLKPFEKTPEQIQYEQALGAWQQAAALAAQKGTEFKTPMPQAPQQQQTGGAPTSPEAMGVMSTQGS